VDVPQLAKRAGLTEINSERKGILLDTIVLYVYKKVGHHAAPQHKTLIIKQRLQHERWLFTPIQSIAQSCRLENATVALDFHEDRGGRNDVAREGRRPAPGLLDDVLESRVVQQQLRQDLCTTANSKELSSRFKSTVH